ncbi:alpha-tocopherol transfer protein-like [Rhodnius prolixus]
MNASDKTVQMGDHVFRFEDDPDPGDFFLEIARAELRETPVIREAALQEVKERIANTENLVWSLDNDSLLLSFLRSCKFYGDSTYEKVIKAYKFREKNAKYFADLNPHIERNVFEKNVFAVLPYRDNYGRRTIIIEAGKKWNPKTVSLLEFVRGVVTIIEAAQLEPKTQIAGVNIIIDVDGLTLSHVWQFSPNFAKFLLEFLQEALPLRIKSVHVVNQPYLFNMLYAIFKPFILEKLRERIFFHGSDMSSLTEHIDPKCLPTQYGGILELETIYGEAFVELICCFQDKIDEVNRRGFKSKKKSDRKK